MRRLPIWRRIPLRRSGEIGKQPSRQCERRDPTDEDEAGPAAGHLHREVLALQEVAVRRGPFGGLFVSLWRHAFHYATGSGRRTGKMQRINGDWTAPRRAGAGGLGLVQVAFCEMLLTGIGVGTGFPVTPSFVAGVGFVLTSTAIVMQLLEERRSPQRREGRISRPITKRNITTPSSATCRSDAGSVRSLRP